MKKKLSVMFLAACLVAVSMFGSVTFMASANISTNSPVGSGIMSGGGLNTTNFRINEDTDPSAYSYESGNKTYAYVSAENSVIVPMKKVPKTVAEDGSKVVLQFDVYEFGSAWSQMLYLAPFATNTEWSTANANYSIVRIHNNGVIPVEGKITKSEVYAPGADTPSALVGTIYENFGFQMDILKAQKDAGRSYATFWFEFDMKEKSYTVFAGNAGAEEKIEYVTVKKAFDFPETEDGWYFVFGINQKDKPFEFDNLKLYSEKDGKQTVYADFGFDSDEEIITSPNPEVPEALCVYNSVADKAGVKEYDAKVNVVNPAQDTSIITLNRLNVISGFQPTIEMTAEYIFTKMNAGRKIGIAMGLESYRTGLSAPKGGATFLYFTVNASNQIVFGVDNIDDGGVATAVGEQVVVEGAALNSSIELAVTGLSDAKVSVAFNGNTEKAVDFDGLKLSGNMAFAHTGSADCQVEYTMISDSFGLTAYSFDENETTESVNSSFDGNYINPNKFAFQSIIAPESYLEKQPTSTHDATGLTAENGLIGFYGTSTNTRLMFKQQYGDFVLQFDYISRPYNERIWPGGLRTGGDANKYSPFYLIFGAESEIPELQTTYALGIVDGNATQYFWGAESLIYCTGKLTGSPTKVLSTLKETEKSDESIPWFTSPAEEPQKYGEPNGETYSLYNKTSRMKLVAINNNVALYAAPVAEDGSAGEYVKLYEIKVNNAFGYVGFGTDSPAWNEIDNVAITPIAKETALELGPNAEPKVDLVKDVAVKDMEKDPEPTPLAKPALKIDGTKVTWQAIENAKEYKVTVLKGSVTVNSATVTATEFDLSSIKEAGKYTVKVEAIPENTVDYVGSSSSVIYEVGGAEKPTDGDKSGCKGCNSSVTGTAILSAAVFALAGGAIVLKKNKND